MGAPHRAAPILSQASDDSAAGYPAEMHDSSGDASAAREALRLTKLRPFCWEGGLWEYHTELRHF